MHQPQFWVLPSYQRFHMGDDPSVGVDSGLVVQHQFLSFQRVV
jgi:hypothetical protein